MYLDFAARIRAGGDTPGSPDPLAATRRAMAVGLGVRARHAPWFARLQKWGTDVLKTAGLQTQERLRALRSRRRDGE